MDVYGLRTIRMALLPELEKKQRLAILSMRTSPPPARINRGRPPNDVSGLGHPRPCSSLAPNE